MSAEERAMLDAITTHERLSGTRFDPDHPNARSELRRVMARAHGQTWRRLTKAERTAIDQLITDRGVPT